MTQKFIFHFFQNFFIFCPYFGVFYCFALFCLHPSPVSWPEELYSILARRDSEVAGLRRKHNKLSSKLSTKVPKSEN